MAGLRRSDPNGEGYRRTAKGRIVDARGKPAPTEVRERVAGLVIPPAWTDVWIAPHANGHIQAAGTDAAGRRQYIYHEGWRRQKDKTKFDRALSLADALPTARARVTRDLHGRDARLRALAVAFRMLDAGALRVGSERYAEDNGSRGLSTLLCAHVTVSGDVVSLRFPGKGGKVWRSEFTDGEVAHELSRLVRRGPRARLLAYPVDDEWHPLSAADINAYVRDRTGGAFTAKDFRTLRGTIAAALGLAHSGPVDTRSARTRAVAAAMKDAAAVLGNTPAIARKSYVDPRVVSRFTSGQTIETSGSPEAALLRLLA